MPAELERAIYLSSRDDGLGAPALGRLLRSDAEAGGYDRVYYGSETCEHALPTPAQADGLLDLCQARPHGVPLTLVTPVCTNRGLDAVAHLVEVLPAGAEVVFNDWGCLELIRRAGAVPVHGRVLNRSTRDPRLAPALIPEPVLAHLRSSMLHDPAYHDFLRAQGVTRVEIDNVAQGFLAPPDNCLPVSLYRPYVHVSLSRYCRGTFAERCRGDSSCGSVVTDTERAPLLAWGTATYYTHDELDPWTRLWPVVRHVRQVGPRGLAAFLESGDE